MCGCFQLLKGEIEMEKATGCLLHLLVRSRTSVRKTTGCDENNMLLLYDTLLAINDIDATGGILDFTSAEVVDDFGVFC